MAHRFQLTTSETAHHNPSVRPNTAFWTTGSCSDDHRGGESGAPQVSCAFDIWAPMTTTNAPAQRWGFSSVWTGEGSNSYNKKIVVWGGYNGTVPLNDGATYDPSVANGGSWTTLAAANPLPARMFHSGIWTGSKMFIWGGDGVSQTGSIHNFTDYVVGPITTINAPAARLYHTGVWTGTEMIIWGGYDGNTFFNSGGRYKVE